MNTVNFPTSISTSATSIDEVIAQLTAIIEWSKQNDSRIGYFVALYRKVTIQVKKASQTIFLTMVRAWNDSISFLPIAIFMRVISIRRDKRRRNPG
ncbi:MAG: DUF5995 family protein [Nitrosomonas sp.]|nr:DUF5995 family protein [Nitrosomonas sp.]